MPVDAVLFDLDDTLFDHAHCRDAGLRAWCDAYGAVANRSFSSVVATYSTLLEKLHERMLAGQLTPAAARVERTIRFFQATGVTDIDARSAEHEYARFRRAFDENLRVVPGTFELLDALAAREIRLGIITNNLVSEQTKKLKALGIDDYFSAIVVSEAVGVPKPDPRIFEAALNQLGVTAENCVMIGDNWENDIVGATAVGISSIWLNRFSATPVPAITGARSTVATVQSLNEVLALLPTSF